MVSKPATDGSAPVEIHVVSDATGETATRVVMAVERQFPELRFEEIRHPRITSVDDVQLAAARARGRRAVVVYTLVNPQLREAMRACCKRYRLHYCDLLGHPLEAVARVSGLPAKGEPGALPVLDSSYFQRVEAIEFAVQADDGVAPGRLREADIVLVGVSRTSKTPLSIYLGYLGYKAANVPLVKDIEPPPGLWEVDPARVVGVTIQPELLTEIRERRVREMRGGKRSYANLLEVYEELEYADAVHRRLGCPVIEVSTLAIEETAHRIIRLVELRLAEREEQRRRPRKRQAS
jgi:regulator of PEP synthase PpsR (kinase-PPPase family)